MLNALGQTNRNGAYYYGMGSNRNLLTWKRLSSYAAIVTSALLLTACAMQPEASKTQEKTSTPTSSATETTAGPTPLAISPTLKSSPVSFNCEQLIPLQTLYDFNPNFALDASKSPADGSPEKQIQDLRGLVCAYVNLSSGDEVQVAVAQLDAAGIKEVTTKLEKNDTASTVFSQSAPNKAFFSVTNGVGVAQIVTNKYWIVCSSSSLSTAEDISPLVNAAIDNSALY